MSDEYEDVHTLLARTKRGVRMSFKGRVVPEPIRCTDPAMSFLNICPTPWWKFFIREFTVWECPHCSRRYRLEWHPAGPDSIQVWTRMEPQP